MKMKPLLSAVLAFFSMGSGFAASPRVTARISGVLNDLDLSLPELAEVAGAMAKKDRSLAIRTAAAFFRKKLQEQNQLNLPGMVDPVNLPVRPFLQNTADDAAAGKVKVCGIVHTFPGGKIDWLFNPTRGEGKTLDPEWQWQLNRMYFWPDMASACAVTGNELYARRIVEQFRSWVDCQARPEGECPTRENVWRTIECGIRLGIIWPQTFQKIASSPAFTDEDVLLYLSSSLEQMRHIQTHYRRGNSNWKLMEMNGIYTFASDFPQFKECAEARRKAVAMVDRDLRPQILPDGIHFELSPGYHFVTIGNALAILQQAEKRGFLNEIPRDFSGLLERGFEGMTKMTMPNRRNPSHNDGGSGLLPPYYQKCRRLFPDNPLIEWMADGAGEKDPRCPKACSNLLLWSGFVIMRSSWAPDANALFFDAGPLGKGHMHQDKLGLVCHGYGEELLYDDGGGYYDLSIFRRYACSPWSHSVIAVDHLGQQREASGENRIPSVPAKIVFSTAPEADYAEASYDQGFGPDMKRIAVHTRQILFLKPDVFIICDRLLPKDEAEHHYEARWQVDTVKMREILPGVLQSDRSTRADLVIAPIASEGVTVRTASGKTGNTLPEMGGLYIGYKVRPWRPSVTVSHEKTGRGAQFFLTMLHPVRRENTSPVRSVKRTGGQVFEIQFHDGRKAVVNVGERLSAMWEKP